MTRERLVAAYRALLDLYPRHVPPTERDEVAECFDDQLHFAGRKGRAASAKAAARAFLLLPLDLVEARLAAPPRRLEERRDTVLHGIVQDWKLAAKGLLRSPGFAFLSVASLALGVGANATILSMASSVLWKPLPVDEPEHIVRLFQTDERGHRRFSYANYRDVLEQESDVLDGLFLHRLETFGLRTDGRSEVVYGELVSGTYFDTLGVRTVAGRAFEQHEVDHPGAAPVVVVGHDLWQRRFGSDPALVGRTIRLNDHPFEVIGVAAPDFTGTKFALAMDLWVPIWPWTEAESWTTGWDQRRQSSSWLAVARLAGDTPRSEAEEALDVIATRLREIDPEVNRDLRISMFSDLDGSISPDIAGIPRLIGALAIAASTLVLLVACANVASLLFARAVGRRQEVGIRFALGVGHWRLLRQLLTESLLLALLGGAAGLALSWLTSGSLTSLFPNLPYRFAIDTAPDGRVILLTSVVAMLSALVFGLAPALQASAARPLAAMRGVRPAEGRPHRGLSVVVVAMVSFSFVSIFLTGLFLRSLGEIRQVAPGFQTAGRIVADYDVALAGDPELSAVTFARDLVSEVEGWPGVERAAVSSLAPLGDRSSATSVFANERAYDENDFGEEAWVASVTPGYFDAMGSAVVAGRAFSETDHADAAPVVLVNQTLAARLWPEESAVGRFVRFDRLPNDLAALVVGVVVDGKYNFLNEPQQGAIYRPWAQRPLQRAVVVAKTGAGSERLLPTIPKLVEKLDARVPVLDARSMEAHVMGSLWLFRMGAALAAGLGFLALGLSAAGLYGVMAYAVSQRRFELGVRAALGATRAGILRLIVGRGLRLAGVGLGLGLLLALGLGSALASVLFGVSSRDPLTLLLGMLTLVTVAFLASLVPAFWASRANPVETLRATD